MARLNRCRPASGRAALVALFLVLAQSVAIAASVRVVDGDTLADSTTTYRLFGIDAPEAGQKCAKRGGGSWPCGKKATSEMERLVVGQDVTCDDRGLDEYGRTLSACRVNGVEVNAAMVEAGLAWSFRKYSHVYDDVEDRVRKSGRGVWQASTQTPWDYRAERWFVEQQIAPNGCPIKGNINSKGEHIYHAPWSPWYTRTKVSPEKGERWFCNESEALKAGWRAPFWGR